ncbi:hypothetical protein E3N88_30005 [Mikania micrantha]|uniref:Chalcone synthase n=1 Tax=Mikania micrantha TaxID=192012 RepID=A0A5N6ML55_9ASTR|nr:hypothetical protein E3N88_30005 [Mikania micrantha]
MASTMAGIDVEMIRKAQRAQGPAAILAIGTATPSNCIYQADYPDYYFRITKSEHMVHLKEKFQRMSDYQLTKLLGLRPSVKRYMMYQQGCFAGGTVLRLAKDLAENNKDARVLVVCSEITAVTFRGPSESHLDSLVGQALFGDGAAAVIIGSDPDLSVERPLFELVSAAQTILPDSEGAIDGHLREVGLTFHLLKDVPGIISKNIEKALTQAFSPLGINDWNSIFWIAHPGGPAILDQVELKLGLEENKMRATRHVLSEYGNMSSACVLFILDEMRKNSVEEGKTTTGEGLDWGVLFGFGPGLTVETVVLHGLPITMPIAT